MAKTIQRFGNCNVFTINGKKITKIKNNEIPSKFQIPPYRPHISADAHHSKLKRRKQKKKEEENHTFNEHVLHPAAGPHEPLHVDVNLE